MSIIINNYNYGRFLQEAIDSALGQSYPSIEVIVVDDGSIDQSREIILSYGEPVISVFKENGGQASALNAGFARSHGEVVIFLDADDILLPHTAQQVAEIFQANQNVAKVMFRMEIIDQQSVQTGTISPPLRLLRSGDLRQHVLAFPFDMTWMATSGNAFAASVLHQIFPIPEQVYGRVGADWYLSHLTTLFGLVTFLDSVGAYYRVHGSNNYELSHATINLAHIRQTITYAYATCVYIKQFAEQLGLHNVPSKAEDLLSVSFLANRMVSLKLDRTQHPIKEDKIWRLFLLGVTASLRRFDVSLPVKLLFLLWFAVMVPAPKPLAWWLAEKFFVPEARGQFSKLLGLLLPRAQGSLDMEV